MESNIGLDIRPLILQCTPLYVGGLSLSGVLLFILLFYFSVPVFFFKH